MATSSHHPFTDGIFPEINGESPIAGWFIRENLNKMDEIQKLRGGVS